MCCQLPSMRMELVVKGDGGEETERGERRRDQREKWISRSLLVVTRSIPSCHPVQPADLPTTFTHRLSKNSGRMFHG